MAFRWRALIRRGSWIGFRKFILEEHRDIAARLLEIKRRRKAIGEIVVIYEKDQDENPTQKRKGIIVPQDTSLHKLCMAYVAQGGNILDISMFLNPKSSINTENKIGNDHPLEGRISPLSGNPSQEVYTGGWVGLEKHYWWKVGRAEIPSEPKHEIEVTIKNLRRCFEKEIKTKRTRIEEKIIKLCDLREQLEEEQRTLMMIRGDNEEKSFTTHANVFLIDRILWEKHEDNSNASDPEKPRIFDQSVINDPEIVNQNEGIALRSFYVNVYEDADSDKFPFTTL